MTTNTLLKPEVAVSGDQLFRAGNLHFNYRRWSPAKSSTAQNTSTPFLLMHGLGSSLHIWDFMAPHLVLATGQTAIAVDQRGHGKSDQVDVGYFTSQIVNDDYALARTLRLEKPVVIGHSWGATIAFAYAAQHPREVSAVVLIDGVLGSLQDCLGTSWEDMEREFIPPERRRMTKQHYLNQYLAGVQAPYFAPIWEPALEEAVLSTAFFDEDGYIQLRLSRPNNVTLMRTLWSSSLIDYAANVRCPVLIINAEHPVHPGDHVTEQWFKFRQAGASKLVSTLPRTVRSEIVILHDSVHDVPWQRPAELSRIMVDFLRTV